MEIFAAIYFCGLQRQAVQNVQYDYRANFTVIHFRKFLFPLKFVKIYQSQKKLVHSTKFSSGYTVFMHVQVHAELYYLLFSINF